MNEALVVVLALIWAIALLPSAIRSRRRNTHATIGGFEQAMQVLRQRPSGRELMVPEDASRIVARAVDRPEGQFRSVGPRATMGAPVHEEPPDMSRAPASSSHVLETRRRIFTGLVSSAGVLFLAGLLFGGAMWLLWMLSIAGLGGYVALLLKYKQQRQQAHEVVRELRRPRIQRSAEDRALERVVGFEGRLQVAHHPDEPWQPQSGVRIRRWDD